MTVATMPVTGSLRRGTIDAYNATRRYLIRGKRQPDIIFGSVLFPVVFVVLFGYVFGSSITVPGGNFHSYLMSETLRAIDAVRVGQRGCCGRN